MNGQQLLDLVGSFDKGWMTDLGAYMAGKRRDALDSVVANRNRIAHGDSSNISFHQVSEYYESVREILQRLDEICLT